MSDLLIPPLAADSRSLAIDALASRMTELDLTPILIYLIDLVPADSLPILAEQFNVVGPLWNYLPNESAKRRAIKESVAWHCAKGTPWSVETALSWAGHEAKVEDTTGTERRWAEYQIELGVPVAPAALEAVLELARFAAPPRSHLVRLYSRYDLRYFRLDHSRLDEALLDDDSGVSQSGIKLSFGTRHADVLPLESSGPKFGATQTASRTIHNDNSWRLDAWALDSEILLDAASGLVNQVGTALPIEADGRIVQTRADGAAQVAAFTAFNTNHSRFDNASAALPDERRKWTGRWVGHWREVIPFQLTQLEV